MRINRDRWHIYRFFILTLYAVLFYIIFKGDIDSFMRNISEISIGGVTIKAPTPNVVEGDGKITSEFTVLETYVNRGKLRILKMQFKSKIGKEKEYIKIRAEDTIDLRFGFIADARRFYGQKPDAKYLMPFDFFDEDFNEDLNLKKGDELIIYTDAYYDTSVVVNTSEVDTSFVDTSFVNKIRKQGGEGRGKILTLKAIGDLRKYESLNQDLVGKLNKAKFGSKFEDGIWKSDYYETDRVIIADRDGEILIDFVYTLLPKY